MSSRKQNNDKSVILKTAAEISLMGDANSIVAEALSQVESIVEAGITTWELDKVAEDICLKRNGIPAFKGYRGFPASLCVSINEEVVHGIPSRKRKLKNGDILSIDFGVKYKGFFGDSAITIPVGKIDKQKTKLLEVTKTSLELAVEQVQIGNRVSDISKAVQIHVEKSGFAVVTQFVGHGIGSSLHEGPEIPNFVRPGSSPRIMNGMVLAIEPMVNAGTGNVRVLRDGWTVITSDKRASAHFEHSIAATENGPLVLSSRE